MHVFAGPVTWAKLSDTVWSANYIFRMQVRAQNSFSNSLLNSFILQECQLALFWRYKPPHCMFEFSYISCSTFN